MNSLHNYSFAQLTEDCIIDMQMTKGTITINAKHDYNAEAFILLCNDIVENSNQYEIVIKLYFKDFSKAPIKKILLESQSVIFVQNPSEKMPWQDKSDAPIPIGCKEIFPFEYIPEIETNSRFLIKMKIYCNENRRLFNMVTNNELTCMMFDIRLISVCNVETSMSYKIWFKRNNTKVKVQKSISKLNNTKIVESNKRR